jgi:GNAT superfamily N-acetyltransferase
MMMTLEAVPAKLADIQSLRALFLQEANCQIRYDACHIRGWTDSYLLKLDGRTIGYGSVNGQERADRDTVFEFYVIPPFRKHARDLFADLLVKSRCHLVECQSNLPLLTSLLYDFATEIRANRILFSDDFVSELRVPDAIVRPRLEGEPVFEHSDEPVGSHVVELAGEVIATGGFLLHYNLPFADLYMEVRADRRRQGYGSFLIQELKRACYLAGRVPAARCNLENLASRATLSKAGMKECGRMLLGRVAPPG